MHCADKTVAASRHGLDEPGIVGIVAERLAELVYGRVQAMLKINESILRPELGSELFPQHDLGRVFEQ
jgi:hypothetical protein